MIDLKTKIHFLESTSNEIAFGYNDSGCFWHFHWGNRGAGNMLDLDGVHSFEDIENESDDFESAVDNFIKHRGFTVADIEKWIKEQNP